MKSLNFLMPGAPKCGTTALHSYLNSHPQVFLSYPKEPGFWAEDFPTRRMHATPLETLDAYESLFASATAKHVVIGESSTQYLASDSAIQKIAEYAPHAKYLVMLRSPINFVPSFHNEMMFSHHETEPDVEKAWRLQDARLNGDKIPPGCKGPKFLQYREIASFGSQLQRLLLSVPRNQVKVLLMEDLVSSPREMYLEVLEFLGLADDGRSDFPRVNDSKQSRFPVLSRIYWRYMRGSAGSLGVMRRLLRNLPIVSKSKRVLLSKPRVKRPICSAFRSELLESMHGEIELLEHLLGRSLNHWKSR